MPIRNETFESNPLPVTEKPNKLNLLDLHIEEILAKTFADLKFKFLDLYKDHPRQTRRRETPSPENREPNPRRDQPQPSEQKRSPFVPRELPLPLPKPPHQEKPAYTEIPIPRPGGNWQSQHDRLVNKARNTQPSLVFYGDSITVGMGIGDALRKSFGPNTENFGISADGTQHLLWRLKNGEADFKKDPEKSVLLIGANNLIAKPDEVVKGVLANLAEMQKQMPNTKVLVLGVLPQGRDPYNRRREIVREINQKLERALAGKSNVRFYDAGPRMLEANGAMSDRVWAGDGVHVRNYTPLFEAIKPELRKF